jgi:hypothetical protein
MEDSVAEEAEGSKHDCGNKNTTFQIVNLEYTGDVTEQDTKENSKSANAIPG